MNVAWGYEQADKNTGNMIRHRPSIQECFWMDDHVWKCLTFLWHPFYFLSSLSKKRYREKSAKLCHDDWKKEKAKKVVWVNLELDKKVRHFRNYPNGQANALAEKLMSTNPRSQANEIRPDRGIYNQVEKAQRKDMWPSRHGNDKAIRIAEIKQKMNFRHGNRFR